MADRIMVTKLLAPRIGTRLIQRPRLLNSFDGYKFRKLTLVSAPAGYGKTVLVSQFASNVECPVVWYQLDLYDNDLAVFIQYLVDGIRRYIPGFGGEALDMVSKTGNLWEQIRRLVSTLVNNLVARVEGDIILVLDDYHVIEEPIVHKVVEEFLNYLPEGVHVVIVSRSVPSLRLSRLKVSGMMAEIDQEELKFNRDEITEFLGADSNKPVLDEMISLLEEETRGWPVVLRLAEPSLSGGKTRKKISITQALRGRREIYNYLATEVLNNLPEVMKSFVLSTSVLDVLTPEICDIFLGRTDSREMLESLETRNLFTVPLEGEEEAYRYHHLFRQFLQTRLGDSLATLLRRAGECYLKTGSPERAVECFIDVGDYDQAIQAIEKAGGQTLRRGQWQTVSRWLWSIPGKPGRNRPWFLLFEGVIAAYGGRLGEAEALIERAQVDFEAASDQEGLSQSLLYKARILRSRGDYEESLKLLEHILPELINRPVVEWYDVILEQSLTLSLRGEFDSAINLLKRALTIAEREGESRITAQLAEKLGILYYVKGDYSKAVEVHQRAVEMASEPDLVAYSMRDIIAIIYRDWGDLDQALEYAQKSIETMQWLGLVEALPYAYHQLAVILADLGDITGAESNFRRAIDLARDSGGESFFLALSMALLGRLMAVEQGKLEEGRALVDEAINIAREQSDYIYGICLEVAAQIYVLVGNTREGNEMLHRAVVIFERIGAKYPLCISCGVMTKACLNQGDTTGAFKYAARCLRLAAAESYIQMFLSNRELLLPVVRIGLEYGIEPAFVYDILKRLGSNAVELLIELTSHTNPEVRRRVIQPLTQVGGKEAVRAIKALLKDSDEGVRDYALAAFQALKGISQTDSQGAKQVRASAEDREKVATLPGAVRIVGEAPLKIQCLGPFRVFIGDEESDEISWRTTKARDLFAYLVYHRGDPVSRERILEEIWPDVDPEQASTLFHTNLYQLRKAVRAACGVKNVVKHVNGQYRLEPGVIACDVERFEALNCQLSDGTTTGEISRLEEAVSLYYGDYLEGLDYEWVTAERERLGQIYLSMMERLARYYVNIGEYSRAASYLRAILRINSLLEDIHVLLMTTYARMGDRMAVIQQYETLSQILERELGIDPSPKTRKLYYKLCAEDE